MKCSAFADPIARFVQNAGDNTKPPMLQEKIIFFFKQKTADEIGLGIPAEPLFRSTLFPILASLLVRLVVLLPFQLLRLSLATPSRWTPLALSVFLHCVVALLLTLL